MLKKCNKIFNQFLVLYELIIKGKGNQLVSVTESEKVVTDWLYDAQILNSLEGLTRINLILHTSSEHSNLRGSFTFFKYDGVAYKVSSPLKGVCSNFFNPSPLCP